MSGGGSKPPVSAATKAGPKPSQPKAGKGGGPISDRHIQLVQQTFKKVEPIADAAAEMFYKRLFQLDPSLRKMFKGDMKEQGRKLMLMIKTAVRGLNDLNAIVPAVQKLGVRHKGYGVKDEHYGVVGDALLWTLGKGLGPDFTDEVREAWAGVYLLLADVMMKAAKKG